MEAHRRETFEAGVVNVCDAGGLRAKTLSASVGEVRMRSKQQPPRLERHINKYWQSWLFRVETLKWKHQWEAGPDEENLNCD